eukprot:NODE_722_length_4795_cov_0.504898.p1 type:complete len:476 gc:universal NODE_722_length_4795_cov_0.504898:1326-2753(+)
MLVLTLSLVVTNAYCVICLLVFVSAIGSNILRNRLPIITIFVCIPLFVLLNISQLNLGYALRDPITLDQNDTVTSCTAWSAVLHLTAPTFFVYFFVRCAHVVLISKAHLAKYFIFQKSQKNETLIWSHSKIEDILRFLNTQIASFLSPTPNDSDKFDTYSVKSDSSGMSFKVIKVKLNDFASSQNQISFMGVLRSFLVVCLGESLLLIVTLLINKSNLGETQPCPLTNYVAIIGLAVAGSFVLPWFILSVKNIRENFGIKKEMLYVCFEIVFFMVLYIVNLILSDTETGHTFSKYLGSDIWIVLMLLSLVTTCMLVPGINGISELKTLSKVSKEVQRSESEFNDMQSRFQETMDSPVHFAQFKRYLVADFAIENGLFYEQFLKYTRKYTMLQGGYTENDRIDLLNHLKKIYNDFIGSNATYELNLPMEMKNEFKVALEQEKLEIGLLHPIAREVSKMLMDNNFPRFYQEQLVAHG